MTEIFKANIGSPPELMDDIFEFVKKPYFMQKNRNLGQRIQMTKYDIETEKHGIEPFSK